MYIEYVYIERKKKNDIFKRKEKTSVGYRLDMSAYGAHNINSHKGNVMSSQQGQRKRNLLDKETEKIDEQIVKKKKIQKIQKKIQK